MSTPINTGGPAFPNVPTGAGDKWADWDMGMTLRDYFAAKAMGALINDPERADQSRDECARLSYAMADAMLKARDA